MTDKAPPIDSVVLKAVVNIKVVLNDRTISDPEAAVAAALDQVDMYAVARSDNPRGDAEFVEFAEEINGAIVDRQDDEMFELSEWVEGETLTGNLSQKTQDALSALLRSGRGPVELLEVLAGTRDGWLGLQAIQGILEHPDSTAEQRAEAFRRMLDWSESAALSFLEEHEEVRQRMTREDLLPALESDTRHVRERALLLCSDLQLDRGRQDGQTKLTR